MCIRDRWTTTSAIFATATIICASTRRRFIPRVTLRTCSPIGPSNTSRTVPTANNPSFSTLPTTHLTRRFNRPTNGSNACGSVNLTHQRSGYVTLPWSNIWMPASGAFSTASKPRGNVTTPSSSTPPTTAPGCSMATTQALPGLFVRARRRPLRAASGCPASCGGPGKYRRPPNAPSWPRRSIFCRPSLI